MVWHIDIYVIEVREPKLDIVLYFLLKKKNTFVEQLTIKYD